MDSILAVAETVAGTVVVALIGGGVTYSISRSNQREARNRIEELETRVAITYSHLVRRLFRVTDSKRYLAIDYPPRSIDDAVQGARAVIAALQPLEAACDDKELFLQLSAERMGAMLKLLETVNVLCEIVGMPNFQEQYSRSMRLAAFECNEALNALGVERQSTLEEVSARASYASEQFAQNAIANSKPKKNL